jgi:hypothetical protein
MNKSLNRFYMTIASAALLGLLASEGTLGAQICGAGNDQ